MALIAHYRLDGDATDAVGNNHGVASNVSWVDGKLGICADSTGSNSAYIMGTSGWKITREFSFSIWAKRVGTDGTSFGGLISTHSHSPAPTAGVTLNIRNTSNAVSVAAGDGSVRPSYTVTVPDPVTEWCHYVLTFKNNVFSVYQNGKLVDSRSSPVTQINHDISRGWVIGRWATSYTTYNFVGYLDDARVYDHALSPREVRDLSLGMVGHYPLLRDAINAAGDNSGSLHGSVVFSDVMGGSAEFDNNSYIQLETGITGDPDELSASFWAKTDALEAYNGLLQFDGVSGGHAEGFVITVASSTTMRLRYWSDGGTNTTWSAGDFATGKESHFCVTLKDNLFTLYQDGEKVGEHTYTKPLNLSGGVKLGLYTYSSNYFTGWIKDARIYATALTAAQVKELYQQRASLDSEGSVHTVLLQELSSNKAPPFSDWSLGQGVTLISGNEIQVDAANTTVSSPTFPVNGASSGYFSAEFWSDVPSERESFAPNAGWLVNTTYYDATGDRSENTTGHTSNGYAAMYPLGKWERMIWRHTLGNDITHCSLSIKASTAYTPPRFRVRNVMWTPYHPGDRAPTPYHAGDTNDTEAPVNSVSSEGALAAAVSEVGVSRGLVAWYPLIGDTKDYAGTNHATNNGAVATSEGYEFDGSASLSANTAIPTTGAQEWTVSALVRLDQNNVGTQYLLNFNMGIRLTHTSTNNRVLLYLNSGVNDSYAYGGTLPLGEWVHLTAVVNETTQDARLHLNGQVYGTSGNWGPTDVPSGIPSTTKIGGGTYGAFRDLRIHNVALTPEEVAIQYQLSLGNQTKAAMTDDYLYVKGQIKEVIA